MTTDERDDELVRRYLTGDADAFTALMQRHQGRIYAVCMRILGNPDDAADATQNAFMTALRKLNQFRGDAAFTTWLHRVAVNACYDSLRASKRQPLLRAVDGGVPPEPGPPLPDHAENVALHLDVSYALRQVPEEFRVALVLADVQDLPYEQIARVLDVPVGTVKSRVHRGRLALARAMRGEGREPGTRAAASEEEA